MGDSSDPLRSSISATAILRTRGVGEQQFDICRRFGHDEPTQHDAARGRNAGGEERFGHLLAGQEDRFDQVRKRQAPGRLIQARPAAGLSVGGDAVALHAPQCAEQPAAGVGIAAFGGGRP